MGPTDPAATRPSRYWFCSDGHSLRPTGAARCREHRGRPWKASLRAPFHSRSSKPEFAARIPSTPHLGSTLHFKRFGVLDLHVQRGACLTKVLDSRLGFLSKTDERNAHPGPNILRTISEPTHFPEGRDHGSAWQFE